MKSMLSVICCLALCGLTASAQKEHAAKGKPMPDQQFLDMAAQTDMLEAHLGQMAADQAGSQDVIAQLAGDRHGAPGRDAASAS